MKDGLMHTDKMMIDNNLMLGSVELSTIRKILSARKMQILEYLFTSPLIEKLQIIRNFMSAYSS